MSVRDFPNKIISGGQTGADMGALIAARDLGIESGGTAPRGWLTEDGPREQLLRSFGLIECEDEGYPTRTRRNVEDSDGTLLVGRYEKGGSRLTCTIARRLKKPLLMIPVQESRVEEFRRWLEYYEIHVLNVAGSRESETPGIAEFTRHFLVAALALP